MLNKFLFLLISLIPSECYANPQKYFGEIVEFGIFKLVEFDKRSSNNNAPTGEEAVSNDVTIVKSSDRIPARLGTQFGILFRLKTDMPESSVSIEEIYTFPGEGIRNSTNGKLQRIYSRSRNVQLGMVNLMAYELSEPIEVMAGTWTFEVKINGSTIIKKEFFLIPE